MKDTIDGINIRSLFARNLKRLRTLANLSQINLAAAADLTHNFINDIENGKKWVSPESIAKLAIALKAEPYQFFIAGPKWNDQGAELFSLYLNDFENSFGKMMNDYRTRFGNGVPGRNGETRPPRDEGSPGNDEKEKEA